MSCGSDSTTKFLKLEQNNLKTQRKIQYLEFSFQWYILYALLRFDKKICWDLSFLDAQTRIMNSMKMAMKEGAQFSNNNQKIQPSTLWREGAIYTPNPRPGFPKLPPPNSFTAHF
jgi:hypothetical protein